MVDDEGRIVMRLEQARAYRGISVAELARRVGVDRKRLWRVLNGERAMRVDEFVRLCVFFGMGIGAFATADLMREIRSGGVAEEPGSR
ncbi:transcriptional regulator [Slackia equolifaciens]|uniref:Transcriptional regulator n=1 Tax=Slackia equolifaciens TaxID=498718 RepID=A0A3N0AWU6_9ACTN|nr:helix-turn-helix domain-containing protein [Slackia equolifaciens]RNL39080.1 transcriptional regulator [Slackia equolifaciens]